VKRDLNKDLDRLLRAAATAGEETPSEPPFGFETRVVALWRSGAAPANGSGLTAFLRRVALVATAVAVVSTVAAVRQFQQNQDAGDLTSNEFAMADSAIQQEFSSK
jgi:hypothetical protein